MDSHGHLSKSREGAQPQPDDSSRNRFTNLRHAMEEPSPDKLETHVTKAKQVLGQLITYLGNQPGTTGSVAEFLQRVQELQQPQDAKFVVIFKGKTGSGKSSTITALCGEKHLLPTNCMRACTAVATEVSWNDSNDPAATYRAEVEFISQNDWYQELQCQFNDIIIDGKISGHCSNKDTPEGVSWAKISTVYPNYRLQDVAETSPEVLAAHPSICKMLGTTMEIQAASATELHRKIQNYVDSKATTPTEQTAEQDDGAMAPSQLWPLIKVVKVYIQNDLMKSGLVLVDLPGCGDSNAARAAVAQNYEKQANATWIVAPISRAVNDQNAHDILNESFKLQLKFDGMHSNVTFICSHTDNLNVEEVANDLGLNIEDYHLGLVKLRDEHKAKVSELSTLATTRKVLNAHVEALGKEHQVWYRLSRELRDGKTVFPPHPRPKKRARAESQIKERKKPRVDGEGFNKDEADLSSDDSEDDDSEVNMLGNSEPEDGEQREALQPLASEQIDSQMDQFDSEMSIAKKRLNGIKKEIHALTGAVKAASSKVSQHIADFESLCIQERNNYACTNMQEIFANGLKMRDEDEADSTEATQKSSHEDRRDCDEIMRSQPVFCISNSAFQGLKTKKYQAFQDVNQTGIPQLRAHARKLTDSGRIVNYRRFLNNVLQLLRSLDIWAADPRQSSHTHDEDALRNLLDTELADLRRFLQKATQKNAEKCNDIFRDEFLRGCNRSISRAVREVVDIGVGWGAPKEQGGYLWNTYMAVAHRGGYYESSVGHIDFNEDLARPLKVQLVKFWDRTFGRKIPEAHQKFFATVVDRLRKSHQFLSDRLLDETTSFQRKILDEQLETYICDVQAVKRKSGKELLKHQRNLCRRITPGVAEVMSRGYQAVVGTPGGSGRYMLMKNTIKNHIESQHKRLYDVAVQDIAESAQVYWTEHEGAVGSRLSRVVRLMEMDYRNSLPSALDSSSLAELRKEMIQMLSRMDWEFRDAAGIDVAPEETPPVEQETGARVKQEAEST